MNAHTDEFKRTFCEQLGEDIDAELCQEVERHLKDCPDCRAQYDSLKETVYIYRKTRPQREDLPGEVEERLYKVLSLKPPNDSGQSPGPSDNACD